MKSKTTPANVRVNGNEADRLIRPGAAESDAGAHRTAPTGVGAALPKLLCGFALLLALGGGTLHAQTNVVPELGIGFGATNGTVDVTVLNGDSQVSYQILRSYSPDINTFTETAAIGTIGQTNFTLSMGADLYRFFRATSDPDWDDDGVENWRDAQPYTNSVGLLSVTIELPANGSTVY
ncbi:MAG: hypothetical protein HC841_02005 [Verrucomicrobiae bacterium]|nr:hypothetical protein [Verrucomicrobiae bacterium]